MNDNRSGNGPPEMRSEIEHGHADYTTGELLEQSQVNAQALVLGVFSSLSDHPELLDRVAGGIAATFAKGWDSGRQWEPAEILDALLTNYRAMGASVEEYDAGGASPRAALIGLPDPDLAETLDVSPTAFRPMLLVSQRLVQHLGAELEWSHDAAAGRIRLQVNEAS